MKRNDMLTAARESEVVNRGFKAVTMIYQLTSRVSSLIEQSHLERNEGSNSLLLTCAFLLTAAISVDHILVANISSTEGAMSQSVS